MAKRQVWVVEYMPFRGKSWITQKAEYSRRLAFEYLREFHDVNPSLRKRTRVVKYVPETP